MRQLPDDSRLAVQRITTWEAGWVDRDNGLVDDEEKIARDLYRYYLECDMTPDDALEKLAFILAMEPPMFTRLVPVLDELRE